MPPCFAVLPPTLAPASDFALCFAFAPVVAKATTLASSLPSGIAETVILGLASQTLFVPIAPTCVQALFPTAIASHYVGLERLLCVASLSNDQTCTWRELCALLLSRRAWTAATVSLFRENPREISSLRFIFLKFSRPEDKLKVRLDRAFRKAGKSDLSTFPKITCGHEWTTQRLVAFTWSEREPMHLLGVRRGSFRKVELWQNFITGTGV